MYAPTALYLYKAVFMAELVIAEGIICSGMKRRSYFALRCIAAVVACIGLAFAIPVIAYNALYCSIVFSIMFLFSLFAIKFCFAESTVSVVFHGLAAYTMQHIAFQIFDLASLAIGLLPNFGTTMGDAYGSGAASDVMPVVIGASSSVSIASDSPVYGKIGTLFMYCSYFFIYILTYYLGATFVLKRLRDSDKFELKNSSMFVFVILFFVFNVIVSSVVTYYAGSKFDALYVILLSLYNIVCSFFTMYLMFDVVFRRQLQREYSAANKLLRQAGEQYELVKRNVELINMKCHDMKHQIHSVAGRGIDPTALKEIDEIISVYDANIRTGNEALDIILTEKSLYCNKHDIKLYCIVDGKQLSFMPDADLYAFFGNILDNAIEAVEKLPMDKRIINLSVRDTNGFPSVNASNCCDTVPTFECGLPKTTKPNKEFHGFGMKSIKLICQKYNGELLINADNGMFELGVVFLH